MKTYVTVGLAVLAGAALLETALIPGLLIGGVAVLAPRYLPKGASPNLRRRVEAMAGKTIQRRTAPKRSAPAATTAGARRTSFPNSPSVRRSPRPSPSGSSSPPGFHHQLSGDRRNRDGRGIVDLQPGRRPAVLSRPRGGLELSRSADDTDRSGALTAGARRRGARGRPEQVTISRAAGQDHHVTRHRLDDGFRDQLLRGA